MHLREEIFADIFKNTLKLCWSSNYRISNSNKSTGMDIHIIPTPKHDHLPNAIRASIFIWIFFFINFNLLLQWPKKKADKISVKFE